jgi:hypothetical protein
MKKSVIVASATLVLVFSTSTVLASTDKSSSVEVSLNHFHYGYEETQGSYVADSEKGWLNGAHLSYKKQNSDSKKYWQIKCDITNQNTNYDGHYLSSGLPVQSTTENNINDVQAVYGIPISDRKNQFVYAGIGIRNWKRSLSATQNETYNWGYIPIGYRNEFKIDKKIDAALDIEVKYMFNGTMKDEENNRKFTLGNKPGFKVELPITYNMNSIWALKVTPWYEYSAIGASDVISGYYEPDSTNNQYGMNIGVQYSF